MSEKGRNLRALFQHAIAEGSQREACWCPSVDVYRAGNNWLIKFDLAGVRPEDIEVELDGRRLTVRGLRRDWSIREGQQAYSMEIDYNRFERFVELPIHVESSRLMNEYRDGMFLIRITPNAAKT